MRHIRRRFSVFVANLLRFRWGGVIRYRLLGAVLGHQHSLNKPELLSGALEQCRQVQPLLVDLHFEPVHGIADRGEPLAQGALPPAQLGKLIILGRPVGFTCRELHSSL